MNVIEVLLNVRDQSSRGINSFKGKVNGLKSQLSGLKGFVGGLGLFALISNITEAEEATAQLDAAFAATGRTVGATRAELTDLSTEIQRTTKFSDDLTKQAEAVLLSFDKVRGEGFERTIKSAANLSSRFGIDLVSATKLLGRALQDPERGLQALTRAGVSFTSAQRETIKKLAETGQAAKAQQAILSELERRFKGSAEAARNTFGGALAGLKNSISDLFEGDSQGTSSLAKGINELAKTLQDPSIKKGIDGLIAGFGALAGVLAKIAGLAGPVIGFIGEAIQQAGDLGNIIDNKLFGRQLDESAFKRLYGVDPRGSGPSRRYSRGSKIEVVEEDPTDQLKEINITVRKIVDQNRDALRELEENTRTSVQRTSASYSKLKAELQTLLDEGLLGKGQAGIDEYNKRLEAGIDEVLGLEEFDLNEIRAKYITIKKETSELGEFMKGVWQGVGNSIRGTIADMLYDWKINLRSLVDIVRRAVAEITAAFITSGIKKAATSILGGLFGTASSFFSMKAGGGDTYRPTIVGEEGPELMVPKGSGARVYNKRQLSSMGLGGAAITYAPVTNIEIIEREDPDKTKREILQVVAMQSARQQEEFSKKLSRVGVEVK